MCVCQSTKRDMVRNRGKLKQARNGAGLSPTHSVVKWVDKGTRLLSSPWQQGLGGAASVRTALLRRDCTLFTI